MAVLQGGNVIDEEYRNDPRREFLAASLQPREVTTPIAGGLEVFRTLIAALMQRKFEGDYRDRKSAYSRDLTAALSGLPEGASGRDVARAYQTSGNPDVQAESADVLLKSLVNRRAPTFSTTPFVDAEGNVRQFSSSGGSQIAEGVKAPQEKGQFLNLGNRFGRGDPRTGEIEPIEGAEIGVSPTSMMSADRADARSAKSQSAQDARSAASRSAADARAAASRSATDKRASESRAAVDKRAAASRAQKSPLEEIEAEMARRGLTP